MVFTTPEARQEPSRRAAGAHSTHETTKYGERLRSKAGPGGKLGKVQCNFSAEGKNLGGVGHQSERLPGGLFLV